MTGVTLVVVSLLLSVAAIEATVQTILDRWPT